MSYSNLNGSDLVPRSCSCKICIILILYVTMADHHGMHGTCMMYPACLLVVVMCMTYTTIIHGYEHQDNENQFQIKIIQLFKDQILGIGALRKKVNCDDLICAHDSIREVNQL